MYRLGLVPIFIFRMLFTLATSPILLIPFSHILSRNWDGFKIRIILYIQNTIGIYNIVEEKEKVVNYG